MVHAAEAETLKTGMAARSRKKRLTDLTCDLSRDTRIVFKKRDV
jgi:hypothetical protein